MFGENEMIDQNGKILTKVSGPPSSCFDLHAIKKLLKSG